MSDSNVYNKKLPVGVYVYVSGCGEDTIVKICDLTHYSGELSKVMFSVKEFEAFMEIYPDLVRQFQEKKAICSPDDE